MPDANTPAQAVVVAPRPAWLESFPVVTSAEDIIMRTIERTLNAKTPEEVLADPDSVGVRDLAGKVATLNAVIGVVPSNIREGDFYMLLELAPEPDGEIVTASTGSAYVMARAAKLATAGWLPRRVRIVELESSTNPGQKSLWITDAAPTVKGGAGEADF